MNTRRDDIEDEDAMIRLAGSKTKRKLRSTSSEGKGPPANHEPSAIVGSTVNIVGHYVALIHCRLSTYISNSNRESSSPSLSL